MFKWKKHQSSWRVRWACHCGAIHLTFGFTEMYEDSDPPEQGFVCPNCGCVDSYSAEKGRYEWEEAPFRSDRNRVWVPWKSHHCSHRKIGE